MTDRFSAEMDREFTTDLHIQFHDFNNHDNCSCNTLILCKNFRSLAYIATSVPKIGLLKCPDKMSEQPKVLRHYGILI